MFGKFRPPLLKKIDRPNESPPSELHPTEPPAKKRKTSENNEQPQQRPVGTQLVFKTPGISSLPRKPLLPVDNPSATTHAAKPLNAVEGHYNVLWRKYTTKKHKTWDGDGILYVTGGYAHLQDISGRDMGRTACNSPLLPGSSLSVGGREVEVDSILSKEDFLAGRPFLNTTSVKPAAKPKEVPLPMPKPKPKPKVKPKGASLAEKEQMKPTNNAVVQTSQGTNGAFKTPLLSSTVMPKSVTKEPTPRHDPSQPNSLIMKRPTSVPRGKQIVDVVVDPLLTQHLREHQREGVKFMYECVMGMRDFDGKGAILADEMGLGKTLQTIALVWTLLKQNPIDGDHPVIKKALIVCPVTLINNWRKEFRKWLGADRLGVYVYDDSKKRITDFTKGKNYNVMIIGYEKLRAVHEELKKGHGIDIVIADEGHRLKTAKNKSALAIKSLDTPRRVILSGTPIQNELSEFFMMVDFVNPDLLGSFKTFTKEFELPIVKSRQPGVLQKDLEKGQARSDELASLTSLFILRRTADILAKYLPSKTEYVLLCRPTTAQASAYQHVLSCPAFQFALGNSEASLQLITVLKKVCNSPVLLNPRPLANSNGNTPENPLTAALLASVPPHLLRSNASTKLRTLDQLLHTLHSTTSEKIVLVSNYTSTLDLLESLLTSLAHPYLRLDGSTPSSKRQDLVDTFNHSPVSECFAFLLSAKSGGVGLNLIGASRLVLFDVDWNPATDLQAMARIHRDGQKRPCVIYRFVMAGGLDEKIWQRQVTKLGLASNIMDQKGGTSSFTREDLRDLFRLDEGLSCQTHDLLGCPCGGRGSPPEDLAQSVSPVGTLDTAATDPDDDDDDDDDELPTIPQLIQANHVDMEKQERKIREDARGGVGGGKDADGTKTKMRESLMAYEHVDTSGFGTGTGTGRGRDGDGDGDWEALIRDEVLRSVLREEGNRVSFVFAKTVG